MEYAYTTSWGVTTRMIGALIMSHGDDDGLRVPPRIAPKHVVILPIVPKPELEEQIFAYANKLAKMLETCRFGDQEIKVQVDKREKRGGEKSWDWIKKGVPLRIEVGPRDLEANAVMVCRRDRPHKEKTQVSADQLANYVVSTLEEIQKGLYQEVKDFRDAHIKTDLSNMDQMREFFTPKNQDKPEIHGGFVKAKWCGDPETEKLLEDLKISIRCLPLNQSHTEGTCILTGKKAKLDAIFAKSY